MRALAVLCVVLAACIEPSLTICGDTACARDKVCDGHGGCATPEQLAACADASTIDCSANGIGGSCVDGVCEPFGCGNGYVTADEICDDGNTENGDGCSADCKSNESCANGYVDAATGEQCDDATDNCHACALARCGDGILDPQLGETCDDGAGNSLAADASCRPGCVPQRCGDGVKDVLHSEVCDDGNLISGDGCRPDCLSNETCGNGQLDFVIGEQCDDGNQIGRDGCSKCRLEDLIALVPGETPSARTQQALTYDGARERLVMFGGDIGNNQQSNETWEWDGASWTLMRPRTKPRPRLGAAMAYDPKRKRIVMFGGQTSAIIYDETWEYDGVDWTLRAPTTHPPGVAGAAMTFDGITGEVMLVAGGYDRRTFTWNGARWLEHTTVNQLIGSPYASAAYAPDQGGVVLVIWNQTYLWDGMEWNNLAVAPGTQYEPSRVAWDAARGHVVLWPSIPSGNNLYELVGSTWQSIGAGPPARTHAAFAYDAKRKELVLHGGDATGTETWLFDGTWRQFTTFTQPSARRGAAAAYDPLRGSTFVYGSRNNGTDTWEFDGRQWRLSTSTAAPSHPDPGQATFDGISRSVVMYGARIPADNSSSGQLVRFDGAQWATLGPVNPTPTQNTMLAYDIARQRVVVFGGNTTLGCGCAENTTWLWNGASWMMGPPGPGARRAGGMAYDERRQRTVLFGGALDVASGLSDTWEWNGTSWTQANPPESPTQRRGMGMTFHRDLGRVVMIGASGTGTDTLWDWSGSAWTEHLVQPTPLERYRAALTYQAASHALLWFGGSIAGNVVAATTLLAFRPYHVTEACTAATLDYDNDGLAGCADPDCGARCTPLCTPGLSCDPALPHCGDGTCTGVEDCRLCPGDCGACPNPVCGDFDCNGTETATTCPLDC